VSDPAWLTIAEKHLGFHETGNNQGIEEFIASAHIGSLGDPWCAIFVNACLEDAGFRGSRSAAARSFEKNSNFTRLPAPTRGCIVTRWRVSPSDGRGHVYFFLEKNENGYRAIAGNEDDAVREYDEDPSKVTGYWWPKTGALPPDAPAPDVLFTVTGKMSIFGGPKDLGSGNPAEGLALFSSEAQMRQHGLGEYILPGSGGLFRRLNPENFYVACRWDYNETPLAFLRDAIVLVSAGGLEAEARAVDWGPNVRTGRVADLSPALARHLGLNTDDICTVTVKSGQAAPPVDPLPLPTPRPSPQPAPAPAQVRPDVDQVAETLKITVALLQRVHEDRKVHPERYKQMGAALTLFVPWFVSVLPQVSAIGAAAYGALYGSGVVGAALGSGATPTGSAVASGVAGTFAVGILNWAKDAILQQRQARLDRQEAEEKRRA